MEIRISWAQLALIVGVSYVLYKNRDTIDAIITKR
jgi:hypothetical protein